MSTVPPNPPRFNGNQLGIGFLEKLIETRAQAQHQLFEQLRRNAGGNPLLNAGLEIAESVSKQCATMERSFVSQMSRGMASQSPKGNEEPVRCDEAEDSSRTGAVDARREAAGAAQPPYNTAPHTAPSGPPAMRVVVPAGVESAVLPLRVRNHRSVVDSVALSALAPPQSGLERFPAELIRFEPSHLIIEPLAEEWSRLHLRLTCDFEPGKEYWSTIVIAGAETKLIPLVVRIDPVAAA